MALKVAMSTPPGTRLGARFRLLLAGLVLCRGLVLLCVIPPFEGWDEYQHLGHVMHYTETAEPAVLGATQVPPTLIPAVVEFPQSKNALEQIRAFGDRRNRELPTAVISNAAAGQNASKAGTPSTANGNAHQKLPISTNKAAATQ